MEILYDDFFTTEDFEFDSEIQKNHSNDLFYILFPNGHNFISVNEIVVFKKDTDYLYKCSSQKIKIDDCVYVVFQDECIERELTMKDIAFSVNYLNFTKNSVVLKDDNHKLTGLNLQEAEEFIRKIIINDCYNNVYLIPGTNEP